MISVLGPGLSNRRLLLWVSLCGFVLNAGVGFANTGSLCAPAVTIRDVPAANRAHGDAYNALFERGPLQDYGWSGGDHAASAALPFCPTCPVGKRHRWLWLFGDSYKSTVNSNGYRVDAAGELGSDIAFGNTAAITYHKGNTPPVKSNILFDYGRGQSAWMPSFIDTQALADMDPYRIALEGYHAQGFTNQTVVDENFDVQVFRSAWEDLDVKNPNRVPVYEYYNSHYRMNEYRRKKIPNGSLGFEYRRIAFYVLANPDAGETVPLYRYFSSLMKTILLSKNPGLSGLGLGQRQLLGHVYTGANAPADALPLYQYFRLDSQKSNAHHKYTIYRNDKGHPKPLMWPARAIPVDNDLVVTFNPVTISEGQVAAWEDIEREVVAIVRDVARPYSEWGRTLLGDWNDGDNNPPEQHVIPFGTGEIKWGRLLLKADDFDQSRLLYIYGTEKVLQQVDTRRVTARLLVARVVVNRADDVANFSSWQFYSDGEWVSSADLATPMVIAELDEDGELVCEHGIGPGPSITRGKNGDFILSYSATYFAPVVKIVTAPSPTGPWALTRQIDFGDYVNERDISGVGYYAAHAHADLALEGPDSGMIFSYIRSALCWSGRTGPDCEQGESTRNRADVYLPRFIDIPMSEIIPNP